MATSLSNQFCSQEEDLKNDMRGFALFIYEVWKSQPKVHNIKEGV